MNKQQELSITFKNWIPDDLVLTLANYIKEGYHVCSHSWTASLSGDFEVEVNLVKKYHAN